MKILLFFLLLMGFPGTLKTRMIADITSTVLGKRRKGGIPVGYLG
jgi:hypothetical protein